MIHLADKLTGPALCGQAIQDGVAVWTSLHPEDVDCVSCLRLQLKRVDPKEAHRQNLPEVAEHNLIALSQAAWARASFLHVENFSGRAVRVVLPLRRGRPVAVEPTGRSLW
jgi:hypothetical protein